MPTKNFYLQNKNQTRQKMANNQIENEIDQNQNGNPNLILFVLITIVFISLYFIYRTYHQNLQNENNNTEKEINTIIKNEEKNATIPLALPEEVFKNIRNSDSQIIDIRPKEYFEAFHIESSINLPIEQLNDSSKELDKRKNIFLIDQNDSPEGRNATEKLAKSGYLVKYLKGGIEAYKEAGYNVISIGNPNSAEDRGKVIFISKEKLLERIKNGESFSFLDVRSFQDFKQKNIKGSINIPLEQLEAKKSEIPLGKLVVVDENPLRTFQACVRLFDLNMLNALCFDDNLYTLQN